MSNKLRVERFSNKIGVGKNSVGMLLHYSLQDIDSAFSVLLSALSVQRFAFSVLP